MSTKALAIKIKELTDLVNRETSSCGGNPAFYNKVANDLQKLGCDCHKLWDILTVAKVLGRLDL